MKVFVRRTILFLILSCSIHMLSGQVFKLRSSGVAYKYKTGDYSWSNWSDWETASVLIVVEDDRIVIYSKETQIYDIIKDEGKITDDEGDEFGSFYCINEDGSKCRVRVARLNSRNGRNQLYIDFNDMKWVYNVTSLD